MTAPARFPAPEPVALPQAPRPEESVDLRDVGWTLWRRRWYWLGGAMLGAGLAALLLAQLTPMYAARAKVMLDPRARQVTTATQVVPDLDLSNAVVDSEVSVLRSNVLLDRVIASMGIARLRPIDPAEQPPDLRARIGAVLAPVTALFRDPSRPSVTHGADAALARLDPDSQAIRRLAGALRGAVHVQREGQSYVIGIEAVTPFPQLSAEIANEVAAQYTALQLRERIGATRDASDWLELRARAMSDEVERVEQAVEDFRADRLPRDGSSLEAVTQQLVELTSQYALTRAERAAAEARHDRIAQVIEADGLTAAAAVLESDVAEGLRQQRAQVARNVADLAARYGPDHPQRARAVAELRQLDRDLEREVRKLVDTLANEVEVARIREASLSSSLSELEARSVRLSRVNITLRQLEREAEVARDSYAALLSRLTDTRSQEAMQRPDARQIDYAEVPTAPSSPRRLFLTSLGGVTGLGLGLALAFLLELTQAGMRSAAQLERETGLPVLATLPAALWASPDMALDDIRRDPYGIPAERLRHVRNRLEIAGGGGAQSVMLLSALPEEGKTTTALALAHLAVLTGKRVILIDADIRRASLRKALRWDMQRDLGDYFGGYCTLQEAIHRDPDQGFDALALRAVRPTVADDLSPSEFRALIRDLKQSYDLVLIDAAPVLAVADAYLMAQATDHCLFVTAAGTTPRTAVHRSLSMLAATGVAPTGLILTKADAGAEPEGYDYDA